MMPGVDACAVPEHVRAPHGTEFATGRRVQARPLFHDRAHAGRELAQALERYRGPRTLVLGIARGGVVVAREVARALGAPLDLCVVRRIEAPQHPQLALGALAEHDAVTLDRNLQGYLDVTDEELAAMVAAGREQVEQRVLRYRNGAPLPDVRGRTVVVVDDGVATGASARAALRALRARGATQLVLAVPVGAARAVHELADLADEVVCLHVRSELGSVQRWYEALEPTSDDDVVALLERDVRARRSFIVAKPVSRFVEVPAFAPSFVPGRSRKHLEGELVVPPDARGVVVVGHGAANGRSTRPSERVVQALQRGSFATLVLDLLTLAEQRLDAITQELRFDIELLSSRFVAAIDWVLAEPDLRGVAVGAFGTTSGAAAALVAASQRPEAVAAVVTQSGRPDLAREHLADVEAPTLLVVGELDVVAVARNRHALAALRAPAKLDIVSGTEHLDADAGALHHVAEVTVAWFDEHVGRALGDAGTSVTS